MKFVQFHHSFQFNGIIHIILLRHKHLNSCDQWHEVLVNHHYWNDVDDIPLIFIFRMLFKTYEILTSILPSLSHSQHKSKHVQKKSAINEMWQTLLIPQHKILCMSREHYLLVFIHVDWILLITINIDKSIRTHPDNNSHFAGVKKKSTVWHFS